MSPYRNIDQVVADRSVCITIGPGIKIVDWSGIPGMSDEVSLNINEYYSLMVKISAVLNNKEIFRGTVTHGYFPEKEEDWIKDGAMVEFSKKKIRGIHKR
jgi:hypothetical protein